MKRVTPVPGYVGLTPRRRRLYLGPRTASFIRSLGFVQERSTGSGPSGLIVKDN
jgi:hypothetical protein